MKEQLVGRKLEHTSGQVIGDVTDVLSDPSGTRIEWLCVRRGRLLAREHLVPVEAVATTDGHLTTGLDPDVVARAPVTRDHTPVLDDAADEIRAYYRRESASGALRDPERGDGEIDAATRRDRTRASAETPNTPGARRCEYVVLLNEPLGPNLIDTIRQLAGSNSVRLHVLVPTREPSQDELDYLSVEADGDVTDPAQTLAEWRARIAKQTFTDLGWEVHCRVVTDDPVDAVRSFTREGWELDGLLVSTPHAGMSRWFRQDLPARVERESALPLVGVVVDDGPRAD